MKKCGILYFGAVLLLCVSFSSCCILKRQKTITKVETIIHVDTLIKVKIDSVPKVVSVYIHDTAYLDNKYSKAVSYYDTGMKKIVLRLQERPFEVKVTFNKTTKEKTKTITIEKKSHWFIWYLLGIGSVIMILLFIKYKNS